MRDTQGTVLPGHRNSPIAPSDQCLSTPGRPHDRHQWRPGARRLDFPDIRHADTRHPSDAPVRFAQARPALKPEGQAAKPERTGTWAPFSIQAFRIIWICNLFANLGTWAQSVAAAWVVTDAHASPLMVAMIQVAAALPLVLLSILSGVIADNHDRRKIMLWGSASR